MMSVLVLAGATAEGVGEALLPVALAVIIGAARLIPFRRRIGGAGGGSEKASVGAWWVVAALVITVVVVSS